MAGTKFAYVRNFELPDSVIPSVYLVVRIDGKGFHKFSAAHAFAKPNDPVALELMNASARHVMKSLKGQVAMAFGESDEYSFLLRKSTTLYSRRNSKITTHIVSLFTAAYVWLWPTYFPNTPLNAPPSFDGRMVVYPNEQTVRDYFSWRQADTHINNLYNTTFWALVLKGGKTEQEATKELEGTIAADKHEILHLKFGINYDQLEPMFRKGTTLVWTSSAESSPSGSVSMVGGARGSGEDEEQEQEQEQEETPILANPKDEKLRLKLESKKTAKETKKQGKKDKKAKMTTLRTLHCDIIRDEFWNPAPTSTIAPASRTEEESDPSVDIRTAQPWNKPDRFHGAGLGVSVFTD